MRIGRLRHRIEIQREVRTDDGAGGAVHQWRTFARPRAEVMPLTGREQLQGLEQQAAVTHRVTLRWRDDVTAAHRLLWGGVPMNIRAATNPDMRRHWLELLCESGVAT